MFKLAKYYLLFNLYKRVKGNVIAIIVSGLAMIFVSFIFSDLSSMGQQGSQYGLITFKWVIMLILFSVIVLHVLKIFKKISESFEKAPKDPMVEKLKKKIMVKDYLTSRSDLILNKYMDKQ